jgi:hypothetical protein
VSATNGHIPRELVTPAGLIGDVMGFTRDFLVMSPQQHLVCALWVVHTHAFGAAEQTPYLAVSSAEKRSGKSRLLEVLALLVREPLSTANTSAPALFRTIAATQPTLLMDETDATFKNGRPSERAEDLRGVLNAGHRRHGGHVHRCVGPKAKVVRFPVYCPKAFAGIGSLPDTVADRSIPIRLERKRKDDTVERFLVRDAKPRADALRAQVSAWAADHVDELADDRPDMPDKLDDRMVEGGEPLIAIADRLGCGSQARAALVALCTGERIDSDESRGLRLLADVRSVFEQRDKPVRAVRSTWLLAQLQGLDESPWQGLTARELARLLRPYELRSQAIRSRKTDRVYKGFYRRDLCAVWERYT